MSRFLRYRTTAAAERIAAQIKRAIPNADVEVAVDNSLVIRCYPETMTPAQRVLIEGHDVRRPVAPSPLRPLFAKKATPKIVDRSTVPNPSEVCRRVFSQFFDEGRIDERTEALKACVAEGVAINTARVYYPRFRAEKGITSSVRHARRGAIANAKPPVVLGLKSPVGRLVKNGVSEPIPGTLAAEVWDMCEILRTRLKRPPKRGEVRLRLPSISLSTLARAFKEWRTFHNLPPLGQFHVRSRRDPE